MYTVKELIETLKQCPQDYEVFINTPVSIFHGEMVGIDHEEESVDLFTGK